ncbi:hypothetical protein I4U23_003762 [Adineta vaga]|nr:hypothetical protein I4U23_003762 [Adineta vaga]
MGERKKMVRTESLSTDRVDGYVDDDIITCPICMNIIWKPVTCQKCENSFCLKCIRLWLHEKPNACPFNCRFQERKPPAILIKLLSRLKLTCQNKSNGCTLLIPYEGLEKHELAECLFRLTECSQCSKEMLYKNLVEHQDTDCLPKKLTCLKCYTVYYQKDGHENVDCLRKQTQLIDEAIEACNKEPSKMKHFERIAQLYLREQKNKDYAQRMQSQDDEQDWTPSAPTEEEQPSSNTTGSSNVPLRISTIDFLQSSRAKKEGDHIPNGYAGFNWENIYYMFEEHARGNFQLKGFLNAYNPSRNCVAFNGRGKAASILLPNSSNKFSLHSFEAMSVYHESFQLIVSSYRSNVLFAVKNIILTKKNPILFEINWERIDKITFTPERITGTVKPETFIIACLNLVL